VTSLAAHGKTHAGHRATGRAEEAHLFKTARNPPSPAARCGITRLLRTLLAGAPRAPSNEPGMHLLHDRRRSAHESFERLVALLGEIGVEFPHFGSLGNKALIGRLRISGLNLDCFFE
jgi:hypothetical protein